MDLQRSTKPIIVSHFALTKKVGREGLQEYESLKEKTMREIVVEAIVIEFYIHAD